jgi:hypothetical protein
MDPPTARRWRTIAGLTTAMLRYYLGDPQESGG